MFIFRIRNDELGSADGIEESSKYDYQVGAPAQTSRAYNSRILALG